MSEITYTVPPGIENVAVKEFLKNCGISSTHWKKIKFSGNFYCNDLPVSHPARLLVSTGDIVKWHLEEKSDIIPQDIPIKIPFEDNYLLIVDKPKGMLVHPTHGEVTGTLANACLGYYKKCGYELNFHPVHRLDRNTSGLVLIVKAPELHHKIAPKGKKLFSRVYTAIVHGRLKEKKGTIDLPIGRDENSIIRRKIKSDGVFAVTHYEVLRYLEDMTLLKATLETGRTHQIRVHFAAIGNPLVGDDLYGGKRDKIDRHALHSSEISFTHPVTNEFVKVTSPLPDDMMKLLS